MLVVVSMGGLMNPRELEEQIRIMSEAKIIVPDKNHNGDGDESALR